MPFRNAFRQYSASPDVHMVSLPLENGLDQWHEQEMDFTSYAPRPSMTKSPCQINPITTTDLANDCGPYLNQSPENLQAPPEHGCSPSSLGPINDAPFSYPELLNMDSDVSPRAISRSSTDDGSSLATLNSGIPQPPGQPSTQEKICPLIAGQIDYCQPSLCGPDAACLKFFDPPPIEECTSIPCISPPAPIEAAISAPRQPKRHSSCRSESQNPRVSPLPSPTSAKRKHSLGSSTQSTPPNTRRRHPPQSPPEETKRPTPKLDAKQRAKAAHSLVEKKYRENLNSKLTLLHATLQNTRYGPRRDDDDDESESEFDFDAEADSLPKTTSTSKPSSVTAAAAVAGNRNTNTNSKFKSKSKSKVRKSDVLSDAMNYVNQTEVEMRHMENELLRMRERVGVLEKLVRCEDCSLLKGVGGLAVRGV